MFMARVWRLRKQNLYVDAHMRDEGGEVEITFLYNGEVSYRRRWPTREAALAEAAARRAELEREGWIPHW
jgi:hypothetical protein